ncbi:MAG TPA: diadenylate cyclase CdaA [Geobacteraceae bacterium]|nr:diadenylate cyclase CdaA [Geobacteraceae bacterium]
MLSFIRWQDIVDIIIMSLLVYQLYGWFKNTKAFQVVIGLGSLGVLYLITKNFGFFMTSWILQEIGTALFVLIIVIFQAEIRQALYRFSPLRNFFGRQDSGQQLDLVELSNSIFSMAAGKTGALIVFQRKEPIDEYLLHGILLDCVVSGQLLGSIFKDGTPLHDGAVIIRHGRVYQASAHLPLSVNSDIPQYYGTRHRAAIGLSERCDAAVVVVSEERGVVSLALSGNLRKVDTPEQLAGLLNAVLYSPVQETAKPFAWKRLYRNFWPKLITVLLVFTTWLIITAREGEITNIFVPATFRNLPEGFLLTKTSPDELEVQLKTFSGLIPTPKEGEVVAEVDLSQAKEGNNNIVVKKEDIKLPSGVIVNRIKPPILKVTIEKKARKWLPVEANLVGKLEGKQRLRKIKIEPSSVLVEGSEGILSKLEAIKTEEINLSAIHQSETVERKLILPASQVRILLDGSVRVRMSVAR